MSEMIERVAKALSVAAGNHPDACSNDEDEQPIWSLYMDDARAAIAAMREPTPEMLDAGATAFAHYTDRAESTNLWQAMIDAAK